MYRRSLCLTEWATTADHGRFDRPIVSPFLALFRPSPSDPAGRASLAALTRLLRAPPIPAHLPGGRTVGRSVGGSFVARSLR